jgi:hypothetical protein
MDMKAKAFLAVSVAALSVLAISPAYAINSKDRIAVINADGSRESGQALATTSKLVGFVGLYEVFWNRDITTCSANVTTGSPTSTGSGTKSFGTARLRAGSTTGHFVEIVDVNGNYIDSEFMITVSCKTAP